MRYLEDRRTNENSVHSQAVLLPGERHQIEGDQRCAQALVQGGLQEGDQTAAVEHRKGGP